MTQKNKENMQRAIGIIEGVSWVLETNVQDALCVAVEILDEIVRSEEGVTDDQN
jgi:hypothetical protein